MLGDRLRQALCVLSVLGTIAGNALANTLPFNGQTTGAVSNRFDVLFVPSGYVFGIWGVLYLTWCVFAVYQFLPGNGAKPRLRSITWLFILSGPANVLWLLLWHYEYFFLTVITMLTLLGLLMAIYLRLDVGRMQTGWVEKWCVDVPFSLYLAWISVATIANVTVFLTHIQWSGWGIPETVWAVIMIAIAASLGIVACLQRRDIAFVTVLVWAFIGIANKQAAVPSVYTTAWVATGVLAATVVIRLGFGLRARNTGGFTPA